MPETAFSTLAEVAASLAALIGFFGLWRLDRLRQERRDLERDLSYLTAKAEGASEWDIPGLIHRPIQDIRVSAKKLLHMSAAERPAHGVSESSFAIYQRGICAIFCRLTTLSEASQSLTQWLATFLFASLAILVVAFWSITNFLGIIVILVLAAMTGGMVWVMAKGAGD